MVILELGNPNLREDALTIDAQPGGSYACKIPPLPYAVARRRNEFDRVEAFHFWEHLYHWEAVALANEILRLLRPNGVLVLELPNLMRCCEFVARVKDVPQKPDAEGNPDPRFLEWGLFGAQTDPRHVGNEFQAHKWGYTPASISEQLLSAGFRTVTVKPPARGQIERDMRVEAVK